MGRSRKIPGRPSVIALVAVGLVVLGYCGVAIGSGLDRAAASRSDLLNKVPAPFRARSLAASAAKALMANDTPTAIALGRLAIDRSPIEAASSSLYATGLYASGKVEGARQAFEVSAKQGWRAPGTQLYWMQEAYNQGDYRLAAFRLDAALRQNPAAGVGPDVLPAFEANPPAAEALAERLWLQPNWLSHYTAGVSVLEGDRLARRIAVLNQLARSGKPLGCDLGYQVVDRAARQGQLVMAKAFADLHCRRPMSGLIVDGNLAQVTGASSAGSLFQWQIFPSGDLPLNLVPDGQGKGQFVEVRNTTDFPLPVAQQFVVAPAGRYLVQWHATAANGQASTAVRLQAGCQADAMVPAVAASHAGQWRAYLDVSQSCSGTLIKFVVSPTASPVRLGRISMVPAGK